MNRSTRDAARILCLAALAALVTACSTLFVGASDRRCAHDLTAVQDSAAHARAELEDGVTDAGRQPTLDRMVDLARRARASCGDGRTPDSPGMERARRPRPG